MIDPLFFSLIEPLKAHLWFDLETYRSLDGASRRLYLVLKKIFHHRSHSPRWQLQDLAVNVLGYSPSLKPKELRKKVRECGERLRRVGVVDANRQFFHGTGRETVVQFQRAAAGKQRPRRPGVLSLHELPIYEQWVAIGVDEPGMGYLKRNYSMELLQEWADITLAAHEHHGPKFFDRSRAAYYIDNLEAAGWPPKAPARLVVRIKKREQELVCRHRNPWSIPPPSRSQFAEWSKARRSKFERVWFSIV